DLDPAHFKNVNIVHIEGYSLQNEKVTEKAMRLAKESGALVSLDLGSFEIVNQYKSTILGLLEKYVDLVFTNKDETLALTGFPPEKGCEQIKNLCEIAVVMIGKEGSWVGWGDETHRCPTFQVEAIDTTGAGDLFASGFLHALLEGKPAEECAKWGAITASTVVQVIGTEIPPEKWKQIKDRLGNP
ncbi:MAG: carbohydrate kinase family protein, partial [Waddliaceae bacterium]